MPSVSLASAGLSALRHRPFRDLKDHCGAVVLVYQEGHRSQPYHQQDGRLQPLKQPLKRQRPTEQDQGLLGFPSCRPSLFCLFLSCSLTVDAVGGTVRNGPIPVRTDIGLPLPGWAFVILPWFSDGTKPERCNQGHSYAAQAPRTKPPAPAPVRCSLAVNRLLRRSGELDNPRQAGKIARLRRHTATQCASFSRTSATRAPARMDAKTLQLCGPGQQRRPLGPQAGASKAPFQNRCPKLASEALRIPQGAGTLVGTRDLTGHPGFTLC
jgi:hypothetical protein